MEAQNEPPQDPASQSGHSATEPGDDQTDQALFLAALEATEPPEEPSPKPPKRGPKRFKKWPEKHGLPDARLDLHGLVKKEALAKLHHFIKESYLGGVSIVEIITGKGLRSVGGRSVLKPAVETWLTSTGARYIKAYADAPRHRGGRGALLVQIRTD